MDTHNKSQFHANRFPGESAEYRAARDKLLEEEVALRRHTEKVAALRRALPPGGVAKDYIFEGVNGPVKLSELFGKHDTLVTYHYMFGPQRATPCPMCTGIVGALNSNAADIAQRAALVVIASGPLARTVEFARQRGWHDLRFVSDGGTSFARDYFGLTDSGEQPMFNVFRRQQDDTVRHTWGSELGMFDGDTGQDPRAGDIVFPLWNVLDMTQEGRGTDWYPSLTYDKAK